MSGSPEGGRTIVVSSGGRTPWQNTFFAIALSQGTAFFNCKASKETKGILTKNRGKAIAFTPDTLFKITQCQDPRFCMKSEEILSFLIVNTHMVGIALGAPFFAKSAIFFKSNFPISVEAFNAVFFLPITV